MGCLRLRLDFARRTAGGSQLVVLVVVQCLFRSSCVFAALCCAHVYMRLVVCYDAHTRLTPETFSFPPLFRSHPGPVYGTFSVVGGSAAMTLVLIWKPAVIASPQMAFVCAPCVAGGCPLFFSLCVGSLFNQRNHTNTKKRGGQ